MNLKGFNVEISCDVDTFFNSLNPYAHRFSSKYVYTSGSFLPSFVGWEPNKSLHNEARPPRGWIWRLYRCLMDGYSFEKMLLQKIALIGPAVASEDEFRSV